MRLILTPRERKCVALIGFLAVVWVCTITVGMLLRGSVGAQAAEPRLPQVQVVTGVKYVWKAPGSGWTMYPHADIARFGVEVDECIQNKERKATIGVDSEDRPPVGRQGTRAWFTFSLDSGFVMSAMDIKVQADAAPLRSDKVLVVMGAWSKGSVAFVERDFDGVARDIRLK
jgi:hypothetical protein